MRRHVRFGGPIAALAVAMALLMWGWLPAGQTAAFDRSAAASSLWRLLNADRANNGVAPLRWNSTLGSLAAWRSADMLARDYFSHTVLGTGYTVFHWYTLHGLPTAYSAENIGWNSGYSDSQSAISMEQGFMSSSVHRANILNPRYTDGGVGAAGADNVRWGGEVRSPRIYTELIGRFSVSSPPPPPPTYTPPVHTTTTHTATPVTAKPKPAPRHHRLPLWKLWLGLYARTPLSGMQFGVEQGVAPG